MRIPVCKKDGNKVLTLLDCEVGNHTGHFPITRTDKGWACAKHGGEAA